MGSPWPAALTPALTAELAFGVMLLLALGLSRSRLGWPLKWAETFYHELSHGVACALTGGDIVRIELKFNGAGCCHTRGGWRLPTLLAGYMGASLWGGTLYMAGWLLGESGATWWLKLELAVLAVTFVAWARDWRTWLILLTLGGVYGAAVWVPDTRWMPLLLQFMGIYVMLNAIRAPLFLIDGQHVGDGAELANMFIVVPEGVWIALWWAFAVLVLLACTALTLPHVTALARAAGVWLPGML